MKCGLCATGTTAPGATTITVERDGMTLVLKGVPADVCDTCGEDYVDGDTMREVERIVHEAQASGVEVAVRDFPVKC
jgi:YgiT-type zinc finger domain-containing protein